MSTSGTGAIRGGLRCGHVMKQEPIAVTSRTNLSDAARLMAKHRLRYLPIIDEESFVRGLVRRENLMTAHQRLPRTRNHTEARTVAQVMEREIETLTVDDCAYDAGHTLLNSDQGCLPIVDRQQRLVGVISEADFVRFALHAGIGDAAEAARVKVA